jgi:hypothetical protein
MPRKKKRAVRGTARANAPSRYAWHRRVPWVVIGAAAIVVVVGVLILRSFGLGGGPGKFTGPGGGVGNHIAEGQTIPYPSYPPTFGPHWPAPAPWGFQSAGVPDERAVHNLEHGGVVASYNNIPPESLAALQALLTTYPKDKYNQVKLLIRPYDKIAPGTLVLTAWEWIDELAVYDDARVRAFLDGHLNRCCEDRP